MWLDEFSAHLVGGDTLQIPLECSVSEAVGRLDRHVVSRFGVMDFRDGLIGRVSGTSITVHHPHYFATNGYVPVLRAEITEGPEGAVLEGRFTLTRLSSLFVLVQVGLVAVALVTAVGARLGWVEFPLDVADAAAIAAGFGGLVVFQAVCIFIRKSDIREIERRVRACLAKPVEGH